MYPSQEGGGPSVFCLRDLKHQEKRCFLSVSCDTALAAQAAGGGVEEVRLDRLDAGLHRWGEGWDRVRGLTVIHDMLLRPVLLDPFHEQLM